MQYDTEIHHWKFFNGKEWVVIREKTKEEKMKEFKKSNLNKKLNLLYQAQLESITQS